MAKHVYKKQANGCPWHSLSKMATRQIIQRRKEQRRQNRTKIRQALLVNDYIYPKYFNVYQEAAQFYNEVNHKYPTKYDLRRTDEFKAWKMAVTGQAVRIRTKLPKPSHLNIQMPNCINPESSFTVIYDEGQVSNPEQNEQPASPESEQNEQPASPESEQNEQPASPESEQNEQPASPESEQNEQPASPESEQNEQSASPEPEQMKGEKIMQLRIPLMEPPTVTTQTLQVVTEEILQESTTLYPSLHEELAPEVIERIISELRQDPDLQTVMTGIEQDLEFQQLGSDIDIPEDIRLENLMLW